MTQEVLVTGIGIVSPVGPDRRSTWRALCRGKRAVRRQWFATSRGRVRYLGAPAAAERAVLAAVEAESASVANGNRSSAEFLESTRHRSVALFDEPNHDERNSAEPWLADIAPWAPVGWPAESFEQPDRLFDTALRAAREALIQAELLHTFIPECADVALSTRVFAGAPPSGGPRPLEDRIPAKTRIGCSIADSKGNLELLTRAYEQFEQNDALDPRLWLGFLPGTLSSRIAGYFGIVGPNSCPVAACATGLLAVMQGADWIADGRCDLVLAGSADASLTPLVLGSYQRLGILAPSNDPNPRRAVRPFAADRQGFAVGEGAAAFVLESAASARRRGAVPLAQLAGWHNVGDASNLVGINDRPDALADCMRRTLQKADLDPKQVGHVNCHGTATFANDRAETLAIRQAFGCHADRLKLTANKSMIGHLLGAAGSVELAVTILSLLNQRIPPTVNLDYSDPECDLDYTPHESARHSFDAAVKLSFGFGGHAASMAVRRIH